MPERPLGIGNKLCAANEITSGAQGNFKSFLSENVDWVRAAFCITTGELPSSALSRKTTSWDVQYFSPKLFLNVFIPSDFLLYLAKFR